MAKFIPPKMEAINNFNSILRALKIKADCVAYTRVDNYFYYDLELALTTRVKQIEKYSDEISLALKAGSKPIVKVLRDKGLVRLEFVSPRTTPLKLFDLFNKDVPKGDLVCLLGQASDGQKVWMDLAQNPHMIVAGTTGSGKSTLLHNIIANLINHNDVNLTLMDPKNIEFVQYDGKFSKLKVLFSYKEAVAKLEEMIEVMEARYLLMRHGHSVNEFQKVVIIIDEFADLIMQDESGAFYKALCRLAQKCRAARMNIILATQRPSVNVIDGVIKANFPARIACRVASHVDSKVILDASGAENLLGKGDALIRDNSRFLERFQVAYTDATEVTARLGV